MNKVYATVKGWMRLGGILLLIATAVSAHAQEAKWKETLRQQLLKDEGCELKYLTGVREFELQGRVTVTARAHCTDERAFDVRRDGKSTKFHILSCDLQSC